MTSLRKYLGISAVAWGAVLLSAAFRDPDGLSVMGGIGGFLISVGAHALAKETTR